MGEVSFSTSFVKTDVTALKVLENVAFVGTGSYLIIYDRIIRKVVGRIYIFEQTITQIGYRKNKILICGENVVALYKVTDNYDVSLLNQFVYNDWILTAKFMEFNDDIALVSMHSEAVLLDKNCVSLETSKLTEIATCYCSCIINDDWKDLFVLSGTAFSQIFIWKPSININGKSPVLYKLKGHKGVIFSIDYSERLQTICSTSDDGKALFWPAEDVFDRNRNTPFDEIREIASVKEIQHRQRVFRCGFFKNVLITALEDSSVKIWSCASDFRSKTGVHQTGPIWCVDFCENSVFTGGADGGVVSTPLSDFPFREIGGAVRNAHRYKGFVLLNRETVAGITDTGRFNLIKVKDASDKLIYLHDDLRSYGLVEKSPCGNVVCLGGMHGNFHLYRFEREELRYVVSCGIKKNPKIFAVHWLSCKTFLTCINDGVLILWYFYGENLTPIQLFELPPSKERWSTSATYCGSNNILIGDRKGNLYLYNIEISRPVQVLKRIQPTGVTKLYYCRRNDQIIVLGRNATFYKFHFDEHQEHLSLITKDKLPFSWLGAYHPHGNKEIVLGFSNDKFVLWDHTSRRNVLEVSCGGGHRLWDFHVRQNDFTLVYQKVDKLVSIEFDLADEVRNVIEGFHGAETNCMRLIRIGEDPLLCVSISGSEDTTLRLSRFDFSDNLNGFSTITTVKSHLSSIRAITYHEVVGNNRDNYKSYFVFSAGGRAQIILWKLQVFYENAVLKEIASYYKDLDEYESEIRIMDLVTTEVNDTTILFAACSNGDVKIYRVDQNNPGITYVRTVSHKERCILKLFTLKLGNLNFLVTATTNGNVTFFDVTDFLLEITNVEIPIVNSIKTNQSGINSYSFVYLDENKAVILTGGDDKAFTLSLVECKSSKDVQISRLSSYTSESFHFAHITGVYITKNYFITASVDQKVIVYRWELNNDGSFKVESIYRRYTSVTDLQGIDYVENKDRLELLLFGNGFEMFSIFLE